MRHQDSARGSRGCGKSAPKTQWILFIKDEVTELNRQNFVCARDKNSTFEFYYTDKSERYHVKFASIEEYVDDRSASSLHISDMRQTRLRKNQ